ncbi:MAG: nucleotidyl transferase AbiEii/AbiGii toxin family protein [Candidatus Rokubacteria bacterium]|nr:nucleotidyl transferase AbiEii/AbiGii toxin family protein [Candidatus Rokubacteria bacterium]
MGVRLERGAITMKARAFWKAVTMDREEFLDQFLGVLRAGGVHYCLVGGQAVNAYAEPVVSLGLDVVVAADQLKALEAALAQRFVVERFEHCINVSAPGSDLRVQIQTDPRYFAFLDHATPREVLGLTVPVARLEDVLQGKIWAALDPTRRPSKRQKDLADIARLLEVAPEVRDRVPAELLARLI